MGVHYRVQVAFNMRPANTPPPNAAEVAKLARDAEEPELVTEEQWRMQYLQDWCQNNEEHRLMERKPAVVPWRAWYLRCLHLEIPPGDTLQKRWREWMREMAWEQLSPLQKLAFDGSLHEIEPIVNKAREEGRENPFLREPNILFYVVLSRSMDALAYMLRVGFGTPEQLRKGETWTGFTALHLALFTQNRDMMGLLWNTYKANVNVKDLFFGSVLDYARILGLQTNAEVYFKGKREEGGGFDYGYQTLEYICQVTMRHPYSWDSPEKDKVLFEQRNVSDGSRVYIPYWNKKSKEMERMPLSEWSDLVRAVYQPFVSARDSWLDELMFNGCYVADPTPELRKRYAAHLRNLPHYETPQNVFMSYVNTKIGFACYASRALAKGDWVLNYTGWMHNDRYKWKEVERTTQFRLNFMKQIHDLGEKGRGIIKKQNLPRYTRDPSFNLPIPGTSYFLNSTECGNMGRIINHSAYPNCTLVIVWNAGVPQALVIAQEDIAEGDQILIDYEATFWRYFEEKKAAKRRGEKPARISLWNYNEEETFMTAEGRNFFTADQAVEMTEYEGFPMSLGKVSSTAPLK